MRYLSNLFQEIYLEELITEKIIFLSKYLILIKMKNLNSIAKVINLISKNLMLNLI